jgi:UDP-N-acetylmuramate--alanine ligase
MMIMGLRRAGLDPSFVVGGDLIELATNAHLGRTNLLVLEVDEAFRTFEQVTLTGLVITNVEAEHLDHFGTVDALEAGFAKVVEAVDGPVVIGHDDAGALRVANRTGRPTFGLAPTATWHLTEVSESSSAIRFRLTGPGHQLAVAVARPGIHNARNAAGVLALLASLGHDPADIAPALGEFRGVRRRFESRGLVAGVHLVDDYAHHPTEITAVIRAAAAGGHRRIWAVFQPHLYSRTLALHALFGASLAAADRVVVTDVYPSREEPIPGVTGQLVADAAREMGAEVDYVPHRADLARFLSDRVEPGDLVITMGAGDITLVPTELARLLAVRS